MRTARSDRSASESDGLRRWRCRGLRSPSHACLDGGCAGTRRDGELVGGWRGELGIPAAENPLLSPTADCSVNQSGPVFFIPPVTVGSTNRVRNCTIEHGKAIAVLLSSVLNDYPCPVPTFQPAPGQSLFDFLLAGAVAGNGDIAEIDVTLDGQPLKDMLDYHFASERLMFFKGDLSLQSSVDSCITGNFQPAAVDAYLILFKPLRPGHHTIVRTIITTRGTVTGPTTTEIDVLPEH